MKTIKVMLAAGLLVAAASASAGQVSPFPVDVDLTNMTAAGDMITARFQDDPDVFIGCGTRTFEFADDTIFESGFCQAEDADGEQITCFTFSEGLINAIGRLADFSFITFSWQEVDDGNGGVTLECNRVGSSTQSFYLPDFKKPRE